MPATTDSVAVLSPLDLAVPAANGSAREESGGQPFESLLRGEDGASVASVDPPPTNEYDSPEPIRAADEAANAPAAESTSGEVIAQDAGRADREETNDSDYEESSGEEEADADEANAVATATALVTQLLTPPLPKQPATVAKDNPPSRPAAKLPAKIAPDVGQPEIAPLLPVAPPSLSAAPAEILPIPPVVGVANPEVLAEPANAAPVPAIAELAEVASDPADISPPVSAMAASPTPQPKNTAERADKPVATLDTESELDVVHSGTSADRAAASSEIAAARPEVIEESAEVVAATTTRPVKTAERLDETDAKSPDHRTEEPAADAQVAYFPAPGLEITATEAVAAPTSPVPAQSAASSAPPVLPQRLPLEMLATATPQSAAAAQRSDLHVDGMRLLQRVARAFAAAQERDGEVRLRLSPPELGSLRLEVRVAEGGVIARMETETGAARTAIIDNLPALRDRLAEQGVRIDRFEVDLMQRQPGGAPDQSGHRQSPELTPLARPGDAEPRRPAPAEGVVARRTTPSPDSRGLNVIV
ncbi:MAG: flagellar hook-length control protein FliK [Pirellulaceae bacterium]|nr:flagellar hook-length control protein FliK [Pirellulaceae bacterium]